MIVTIPLKNILKNDTIKTWHMMKNIAVEKSIIGMKEIAKERPQNIRIKPTTLQKWKSQLKQISTLEPKNRKGTWCKIDTEKLKKYKDEYPYAYLREIAAESI